MSFRRLTLAWLVVILSASLIALPALAGGKNEGDETAGVYELASLTTLPILPPPLRMLLETRKDSYRRTAHEVLSVPLSTEESKGAHDERHYVMLDVVADSAADAAARREAARRFPHDRESARKLYRKQGHDAGGELPWIIEEHYQELVKAFMTDDRNAMVHRSALLIHFAVDASLPFNATADREGKNAGGLHWTEDGSTQPGWPHRSIRHRFQLSLMSRLQERLAFEARVWPQRVHAGGDCVEKTFTVLLEAYDDLEELFELDRAAISELGIVDAKSFLSMSDAYYARVADRAGSILESRIEAGVLLAANLITGAWIHAGSPSLGPASTSLPAAATKSTAENAAPGRLAGSRESTVYHRADCAHIRRIKAENLVYFDSAEQARADGRSPCKACKPDEP